jgi:hypothetical protein
MKNKPLKRLRKEEMPESAKWQKEKKNARWKRRGGILGKKRGRETIRKGKKRVVLLE